MDFATCRALLNSSNNSYTNENYYASYAQNNYYKGSKETWKNLELSEYFKLFAYVIVIIGGLLGNMSIILTVALNKSMRTTINFYVTNLAVADLMICILCMIPEVFSAITANVYFLGRFMCKFHPFTKLICLVCSVLTLSAISCDRFFAIVFPLRARAAKQRTSLLVTVIWIISIAVSIPLLLVKHLEDIPWIDFTETQCGELWAVYFYLDETKTECEARPTPMRVIYYTVVLIILYFLPVVIMISAYSSILWRMRKTDIPGEHIDTNINVHSRNKKKVNRMIFFVLVAFIICWTPIQTIQVYSVFFEDEGNYDGEIPNWLNEFVWTSHFLAYANSFINPFIYGAFNKTFREGFCNVLRCGCKRGQFGMSGLSRLTFTTRFTSSRSGKSAKSQIGATKTSQKSNKEMELMHPIGNKDVLPAAGEDCVAIAETR